MSGYNTLKSITDLKNNLKDKNIFMIIGNGSKNQFKDTNKIKKVVSTISSEIKKNPFFYILETHQIN